MPLVRISHTQHLSPAEVKAASTAVHQSLVEQFAVPGDDFFQIITGHAADAELLGPPAFLGVKHTPNLLFVQITCAEGRTLEQKRKLYAAIAAKVAQTTRVSQSDVVINLLETRRENWSFGDGVAQFAPEEP